MEKGLYEIILQINVIFREKGLRLSVAESCTGGLLSHYLTEIPGASAFFDAGLITYSTASKENLLGVTSGTIMSYGVISEETAKEMAGRMRILTASDYSVSVTGNLGPDVLEGKEKGLVYIAVSSRERTFTKALKLTGERTEIKEKAALAALEFLIGTAISDYA